MTRRQIAGRLEAGRLHELHRGVYLVGPVPPRYAPEMAALLACGDGAVLSHRSAAALWMLIPYPPPGDVCVTVPPARTTQRDRIDLHRAQLRRRDIRWRHRMPLTSPPRVVLEMAAVLDEGEYEAFVAEAQYRRLASEAELRDQIEGNPGRRGVGSLSALLDMPGGPRRTRSPYERKMLALLRREGVTGYETNARVHGYEVDFWWPERRLVLEVDGFDGHSGRVAFERDRLKLASLTARGLTVMLITGRQIDRDPQGVLARLLAALRARSAPEGAVSDH